MSWLAPTATDRDLVDQVEALSPALYRLALVLAPALRVEPLLLRNARLRFLPQSDAGLEAELWFSPLVSARSARSVLLRPGAARVLADRLETEEAPFTYAEVWRFIDDHTQGWRFEDRLEQALRQSARHGDVGALREGLRTALRRVADTPSGAERRDLARWLKGALPALAGEGGAPGEVALAAGFAAASLGDPGGTLSIHIRGSESLPAWLRDMIPSGKSGQIGLRLWPGVLEMLSPEEAELRIDLGAPSPAPLHIQCAQVSDRQGRWESCWPGRRLRLPAGCTELMLTTLIGARYRLAAKPGQVPPQTEAKHPPAGWPVLVAHYPEDAGAAEQIRRLLTSVGIEATLIPESDAPEPPGPEDALLLRLWTRSAYRRSSAIKAGETAPRGGLVVRMDDAPLLPGTEAQGIVDLSIWQGDPQAEAAKALLEAMQSLGPFREPLRPIKITPKSVSMGMAAGTPTVRVSYSGLVVFVYSHQDSQRAELIAELLRAQGFEVWSDAALSPGEGWAQQIEKRLSEAQCGLVFWSAAALESRWLLLESSLLQEGQVVTVLLDQGLDLPPQFEATQAVDLTEWDGSPEQPAFRALVTAVAQVVQASRERQQKMAAEAPAEPGARRDDHPDADRRYPPEIESLLAELDREETPPERRLAIGDRLAALGDPRPGVGLSPDGLPDIDWVDVPDGEFLFGNDQRRTRTDAFRISRYPVTNAQYQAFIDAGGYHEERWWQGLAQHVERPEASRWPHPNRPRTDVSWYEAVAFCRWLSAALGMDIRLPAEIEWEKAARGSDGREYPWGNGYRAGCANIDETWGKAGPHNLQQTTAVGIYPQGASPYGVLDLTGNVWEWCLNEYGKPERIQTDGTETRVLRGGSWFNDLGYARSAYRDGNGPVDRFNYVGFRVLCSSPIIGH